MKKIRQYGEKSVYVERNTGAIHIHSPEGEIKINDPNSAEGIDCLRNELGEQFEELKMLLQNALADQSTPHYLTEPPFSSKDFIGRERELQALHQKLFAGTNILFVVNGNGGIGKTSLTSHYYQEYKDQYAHVAWVLNDKNIADAILLLAYRLNIQFEEAASKEQRLTVLLAGFAKLRQPSLLVIDNVNRPENLHDHYQLLNKCSNYFHILITSRITKFKNIDFFPIEGLPEKEAVTLFKNHYKGHQKSEDALLKEIISAVGSNTLIIELLAKNLQNLNELEPQYSLTDMKDDIEKSLIQLSQSDTISTAYQATGTGLRNERPESIVLAMYDVGELSDEEKQLISIFAVLPNERIPYSNIKALLPDAQLHTPLLKLSQKGWIDYNEVEKSFKINQVVQDVVKAKHKDRLIEDLEPAISALGEALLSQDLIHRDNYETALELVSYAESIVRSPFPPNYGLTVLCSRIGVFYSTTGDLINALNYFEDGAKLTEALYEAYPQNVSFKNGLAISYEKLGSTHTALGNLEKALKYFEDETKLFEALYEAYPQNVSFKNGLAISYEKLGETHTALGNLEKALKYFEDETKLFEALYEAYPQNVSFKNGLAISYSKLGETHTALGNLEKALKYFEDRSKLGEALYEAYPQNVSFKNGLAISYEKLGSTHTALGNLEKALKYFEDETKLFEALYEAYPQNVSFKNGLAISYSKLGETHTALGNLEKALKYFEDRSKLGEALYEAYPQNVSFKNGLAISYEKLGSTHTALGNLEKALKYFEDETKLFEALYEAYPQNVSFKNGLAISYSKLGETHTALGNLEKALKYFEDDAKLTGELYEAYPQNVSFKNGLAVSYAKLGSLYDQQIKDQEKAKYFIQKCFHIWSELSESYPQHVEFKRNFEWAANALSDIK